MWTFALDQAPSPSESLGATLSVSDIITSSTARTKQLTKYRINIVSRRVRSPCACEKASTKRANIKLSICITAVPHYIDCDANILTRACAYMSAQYRVSKSRSDVSRHWAGSDLPPWLRYRGCISGTAASSCQRSFSLAYRPRHCRLPLSRASEA